MKKTINELNAEIEALHEQIAFNEMIIKVLFWGVVIFACIIIAKIIDNQINIENKL